MLVADCTHEALNPSALAVHTDLVVLHCWTFGSSHWEPTRIVDPLYTQVSGASRLSSGLERTGPPRIGASSAETSTGTTSNIIATMRVMRDSRRVNNLSIIPVAEWVCWIVSLRTLPLRHLLPSAESKPRKVPTVVSPLLGLSFRRLPAKRAPAQILFIVLRFPASAECFS
jgi:hypothetical protein